MDPALSRLTIEELVRGTILRFDLMDAEDLVLVGFSGGPDSTALALVLDSLRYRCVLGHVDHQMRQGSGLDVEHAHRVARDLGLALITAKVQVLPPTEARARELRYRALTEMAAQAGASRIATGHTLDDAAETVVMRLRRGGTGLGIPPRRGSIVRPLIECRRSQTVAYCAERGVDHLVDPTNLDMRFTRNRIRAELSSLPDREVLDLAEEGLRLVIASAGSRQKFAEMASALVTHQGDELALDRQKFSALEDEERRGLIRFLLEETGSDPSSALVEQVCRTALRTGARTDFGGLSVWTESSKLMLGRLLDPPPLPEVMLPVHGTVSSREWGLAISVSDEDPPEDPSGDPAVAWLDAAAFTGGALTLRSWRPGDRMRPMGSPGRKKLQDLFTDRKVPRMVRDRVPVICLGDKVVWVVGHAIDEDFKVGAATTRVKRIVVLPASGEDD